MHPSRTPLLTLALARPAGAHRHGLRLLGRALRRPTPAPAPRRRHPPTTPRPWRAGAGWLERPGDRRASCTTTSTASTTTASAIDVALALHAVGEQPRPPCRRSATGWPSTSTATPRPGYGTVTSAGGTAKAVVLAEAVGADPTSYGGTDLVAQLEGTVADRGPVEPAGSRTSSTRRSAAPPTTRTSSARRTPSPALDAADSDRRPAPRPTSCSPSSAAAAGSGWTSPRTPSAADQTCDGDPSSKPDLDATAFAVRALSADDSAPASRPRSTRPWPGWSSSRRRTARSAAARAGTPNSNSTGLAGTALAEAGEHGGGRAGRAWVFQPPGGRLPAVRPGRRGRDRLRRRRACGRGEARASAAKTADQFRRASAEALPVLQWLPAEATADQPAGSC